MWKLSFKFHIGRCRFEFKTLSRVDHGEIIFRISISTSASRVSRLDGILEIQPRYITVYIYIYIYIYICKGFFIRVVMGKVIRGLMFSRWITVAEEMVENFMGNRMSTVYDRDFEKLTRSSEPRSASRTM